MWKTRLNLSKSMLGIDLFRQVGHAEFKLAVSSSCCCLVRSTECTNKFVVDINNTTECPSVTNKHLANLFMKVVSVITHCCLHSPVGRNNARRSSSSSSNCSSLSSSLIDSHSETDQADICPTYTNFQMYRAI